MRRIDGFAGAIAAWAAAGRKALRRLPPGMSTVRRSAEERVARMRRFPETPRDGSDRDGDPIIELSEIAGRLQALAGHAGPEVSEQLDELAARLLEVAEGAAAARSQPRRVRLRRPVGPVPSRAEMDRRLAGCHFDLETELGGGGAAWNEAEEPMSPAPPVDAAQARANPMRKARASRRRPRRRDGNDAEEAAALDAGLVEEARRRLFSCSGIEVLAVLPFGSRATGGARPDSDLDLVVVVPDEEATGDTWQKLRQALRGLNVPIDLFLYSRTEAKRWAPVPGTPMAAALRANPNSKEEIGL